MKLALWEARVTPIQKLYLRERTAKLNRRNLQNRRTNTCKRHCFLPDIIGYAVWLYYRLKLSHRDIEDLLAERGITVSRKVIRLWCIKFGARERGMKRFKSMIQAQRFVTAHAAV